jgi:two-component system NtrC family sensor kinase
VTDAVNVWKDDDIRQGIESALALAANEINPGCEVRKDYGDLPVVACVLSQVNQVFLNLLLNAIQAVNERGVVSIRTGRQRDEVWVEIADTGDGIPGKNLSLIFEPFFTTKPVGKGSGLGLAIAYAIVERHRGRIEVKSEVGKGSTFRVWLPIERATR